MTTLIRLGLSEHHRRGLVRVMREELTRTDDPQRVLGFARRWLYDHRLIIVHERRLRAMISTARRQHEAELGRRIADSVSTPEPCRPTPRRSTETRQQQSASVSWSQTTEIVGGRFKTERQRTPPVEILFRKNDFIRYCYWKHEILCETR